MSTDDDAIEEFLRAEYVRVVGAVSLVTGNRAQAEEAVQEALVRAWEHRNRDKIASLRPWITVTALNVARSWFRRLLAERRALARLETQSPTAEPDLESVEVRAALRQLPRRSREAVVLHYFMDMSVAEIARAQHVSEGAAKNALHRGRQALARVLADVDNEVDQHVER